MLFLISLGIYGDLVSGNIIGGRGGMRKQGMVLMGIIMENLNLAKPASSAHQHSRLCPSQLMIQSCWRLPFPTSSFFFAHQKEEKKAKAACCQTKKTVQELKKYSKKTNRALLCSYSAGSTNTVGAS